MTFKDEDIFNEYLKEIEEKKQQIKYWKRQSGYPHRNYDYGTDDFDDYEYQQDQYL